VGKSLAGSNDKRMDGMRARTYRQPRSNSFARPPTTLSLCLAVPVHLIVSASSSSTAAGTPLTSPVPLNPSRRSSRISDAEQEAIEVEMTRRSASRQALARWTSFVEE
jgi:hypothetical protein